MKTLAVFFALVLFGTSFYAQVAPATPKVNNSFVNRELSVILGPVYSNIKNENLKNDKYAATRGAVTVNAGFNYFLAFSKYVGYTVGLEYNQFKNITAYKGYFRYAQTRVDNSGALYYPLVDANYTTTLSFTTLDIPLSLRLKTAAAKNIEVYLDAGVKMNATLSYKMRQTGFYDKKGLYPLRNGNSQYFLIENDPSLGFTNTTFDDKSRDVQTSKVGFSMLLAAGVKAITSEKTFITFNFVYLQGVSDLNADVEPNYVDVFGDKATHLKYTAFQLGLRVGVGFTIE